LQLNLSNDFGINIGTSTGLVFAVLNEVTGHKSGVGFHAWKNDDQIRARPLKKSLVATKKGIVPQNMRRLYLSGEHTEQMSFQESEYFRERAKERYKIEAKNSELKHRHGYDVASSSGLVGMQLQGAMAIFAVNIKRILKLIQ